jgi:signal peptidase II
VKKLSVVLIILVILAIDQAFKFYIKTRFYLGEDHAVIGNWFRLHFVENEGMAWGWKLGGSGSWGKIALTVFRMLAVCFGVYYIGQIIKKKFHTGFIICVAMIFAGAVGNLIDSLFYGMVFDASDPYAQNLAKFMPEGGGYAGFLHGKVVDMLYFPIVQTHYPNWFPLVGGEPFEFFSPVFNVADASISLGLIIILLFQNRFFNKQKHGASHPVVEANATVSDETQIS